MTELTATFLKLRSGSWGIRVAGGVPDVGQVVSVSRAGGVTKDVTVSRVIAQFDDACLCAIADTHEPTSTPEPTTSRSGLQPTPEQAIALELFKTGKSLAIEAGAGTGKTSTLVMLADSTNRIGQYVAFNRAIVADSKGKMPANVRCNTAHSLAFQAVGKHYQGRLDGSKRMKSTELAKILRTEPVTVTTWTGESKRLGAPFLASVVMATIERFCTTADREPSWRHMKRIDNLDAPIVAERPSTFPINEAVARAIEPALKRAWADLQRYSGALPYKPSHYLKTWQLGNPIINAAFILFDEAQDASPVMVDIIAQQKNAQLVWVGDSQQQIYSFTGAINALAQVPAEQRAFLSQSFRFGQDIADVANRPLTELKAELRLRGFEKVASTVGAVAEPHAILCRTNAAAVRQVLDTLKDDRKPFLVGGAGQITSFVRAAKELMETGQTDHPELACFGSWGDVQEYVESDEQGIELRLMVGLIDEFGIDQILEALEATVDEASADVVVSTAHKAKGREWQTVRLASDFVDEPKGEELRLLYVAVTRAKLRLDVSNVSYFAAKAA